MAKDIRWESVIEDAMRQEMARIAAEEIAAALLRTEKRTRERLPEIVMRCVGYFDIARDERRIIITVKPDHLNTTAGE